MSVPIDLTGQRFGRLLVLSQAENRTSAGDPTGRRCWNCICDCGNKLTATTMDLRKGDVKSCGCYKHDATLERMTTHGESKTRLYKIWKAMRRRCYDTKVKSYDRYGGRGITVCKEWDDSYEAFRDWSLAHGYDDTLSIDRIDCDGNYEPDNCRWTTMKEQSNNRKNSRFITYNGETHTIAEWSDVTGISYHTLYMRLYNGYTIERALAH